MLGAFGLGWHPDSPGPLGLDDRSGCVADPHETPAKAGTGAWK